MNEVWAFLGLLTVVGLFIGGIFWGLSFSDDRARAAQLRCAALHGVMIDSTNTCVLGCTAVVTP